MLIFIISFTIGGDLNNNGSIRLTNQSVPNYYSYTSTGAANLFFIGRQNNTATLNGTTDLYNLIINKGSDQTHILTLNSTSTSNFVLYGPNLLQHITTAHLPSHNPEVRKALWIRNGTLKLTGFLNIPTLMEGSSNSNYSHFVIPQNACLWIAGDDVKVYTTARADTPETAGHIGVEDNNHGQGLSIYGKLRISAGSFDTRNSLLSFFSHTHDVRSEIVVEGGTLTAFFLNIEFWWYSFIHTDWRNS